MPENLSVEQFGATVKKKYPQYSSFSDTEIGTKMLEKYPEYKSRVVTTPAPKKSLTDKVLGGASAFTDFIGGGKLAEYLGGKINRATLPKSTQEYLPPLPSTKEVVGSAAQVGSLFVPYGTAAKGASLGLKALGVGSKLAKVGGNVAAGAAGGALYDVGGSLQGQPTGGAGTIIGGAIPLVPPALKGAAKLASESLGVTTGVGGGVTRSVFNAARAGGGDAAAVKSALRGNTSPDAIVQNARESLGTIVENRTADYQKRLADLTKNKTSLDISPVTKSIQDNLNKFRINITKNGALDFSQSAIRFDKKAQQDVATIFNEMKQFGTRPGDRTAVGVDALKRALGDLYSDSSNVRAFTTSVKNAARDVLKQVKGYDEMAENYQKSTGLIKEIQRGLSLGDKAQTDTAFRKLATALRVNNEFRKQLISELDAVVPGQPLSAQIAGQQMSELLPRGIMRAIAGGGAVTGLATGAGILTLLKAAVFTSPRVVGEVLYALGLGARQVDQVLNYLKGTPPAFPGDILMREGRSYFEKNPPSLGLSMRDVTKNPKGKGGVPNTLPAAGVTLKTVERLLSEVKSPTVGRETIEQIVQRGDVKQAEKDVIRSVLGTEKEVNVADFANRVKSELLPLKKGEVEYPRYENVNLSEELRGPIAGYKEHVYESPIKTSGGDVHFSNTGVKTEEGISSPRNYFAHTRIEDLPKGEFPGGPKGSHPQGALTEYYNKGSTRRVIEIQSDLFQKGRLSAEMKAMAKKADEGRFDEGAEGMRKRLTNAGYDKAYVDRQVKEQFEDYNKLEPYRNTWWERVVREEVKQAAKDGKTKLQFPTGETAMKIEGLGETADWRITPPRPGMTGRPLTTDRLEVGMEVNQGGPDDWIITDVLGNGKFKAVQKDTLGLDNDFLKRKDFGELLEFNKDFVKEADKETFDISGKVDKENPIFKFYEKDVARYLKNKYGAKVVIDPQGVQWIELDVPKDTAKMPVEAFGLAPLVGLPTLSSDQKSPLPQQPSRIPSLNQRP